MLKRGWMKKLEGHPTLDKLTPIAEKLRDWFDSCGMDLFIGMDGEIDESMTFKGGDLAAMAVDYLDQPYFDNYFNLSRDDQELVKRLAYGEKDSIWGA